MKAANVNKCALGGGYSDDVLMNFTGSQGVLFEPENKLRLITTNTGRGAGSNVLI